MSIVKHCFRPPSPENSAARGARRLLVAAGALVFFEQAAGAYVDPGAGTLAWQMVVAGLVGCLFYLRKALIWVRRRDRRQ